jgi:hypothetical protein
MKKKSEGKVERPVATRDSKFKMSKGLKQIMTCLKFSGNEQRDHFRNMMVDAEVHRNSVERVVYDKLVPNVAGYGLTISEE